MILYLKTANYKQLAIGNTYWPTKPHTQDEAPGQRPEHVLNNSLWNKYVKWLRAAGSRETSITYLRRCMEMRFDKHMEKGFPAILMGDFNAHWDGVGATYSDLAEWAADCCWGNEINDRLTDNHTTLDTFI